MTVSYAPSKKQIGDTLLEQEETNENLDEANRSTRSAEDLLFDIVREMKKMNLYLHIITDTHIKNTEVE